MMTIAERALQRRRVKLKAAKPAKKAKKAKAMSGKSLTALPSPDEFKPMMHLDGKQIPQAMAGAKMGMPLTVAVTGRVVRRTEEAKGPGSVTFEVDKIAPK